MASLSHGKHTASGEISSKLSKGFCVALTIVFVGRLFSATPIRFNETQPFNDHHPDTPYPVRGYWKSDLFNKSTDYDSIVEDRHQDIPRQEQLDHRQLQDKSDETGIVTLSLMHLETHTS